MKQTELSGALIIFLLLFTFGSCSEKNENQVKPAEQITNKYLDIDLKVYDIGVDFMKIMADCKDTKALRLELCVDTMSGTSKISEIIYPKYSNEQIKYTHEGLFPGSKYFCRIYSIEDNMVTRWVEATTVPLICFKSISQVRPCTGALNDISQWEECDVIKEFAQDKYRSFGAYFVWGDDKNPKIEDTVFDYQGPYCTPCKIIGFDDSIKTVYVYYPYKYENIDMSQMKRDVNTHENINYLYASFPMKYNKITPIFMESTMTQMRLKVTGEKEYQIHSISLNADKIGVSGTLDLKKGKYEIKEYAGYTDISMFYEYPFTAGNNEVLNFDRYMFPQKIENGSLTIKFIDNTEKEIKLEDFRLGINEICTLLLNLDEETCEITEFDLQEATTL